MNDMNNDDFEFKPLTKGLGFHPKKDPVAATPPAPVTPKAVVPPAATSTAAPTARSLHLNTPLPRPETRKTPAPSNSTQTIDNLLKNLNEKNKNLNFDGGPQSSSAKTLSPYLQTAPNLAAGFLDLLLVTALSLLYLMTLVLTLKIDLVKSITEGGLNVWLSTGAVFVAVSFIYYVTQRMFLGFTVGEWAYEQRLGLPEEMKKPTYSLRVVGRQLLMLVTGGIFIPLISWAMGRDMGGISGLCTYRKR